MAKNPHAPERLPWPLVERYLAGELPAGDAAAVEGVLSRFPEERHVLDAYRNAVGGVTPRPDAAAVEGALARLHELLAVACDARTVRAEAASADQTPDRSPAGTPAALPRVAVDRRRHGGGRFVRTAAAATAFGAAAVVGLLATVGRAPHSTPRTSTGPARTYATATGQRATVTLADGSRVTLAPRTTLTVPRDFDEADRTLAVDGEAYFEVRHAASAPFRVRTRSVTTQVLGTEFAVRYYPGDPTVRVVVRTGKVAVGGTRSASVTLAGGMIGYVTDSTGVTEPVGDVEPYVAWTGGHLDFRDTPVPELLSTLERWHGVRFQLVDTALARARVTAVLDYSVTADLVRALETLLDVTATSEHSPNGVVITLHPRRQAMGAPADRRDMERTLSSFSRGFGR